MELKLVRSAALAVAASLPVGQSIPIAGQGCLGHSAVALVVSEAGCPVVAGDACRPVLPAVASRAANVSADGLAHLSTDATLGDLSRK